MIEQKLYQIINQSNTYIGEAPVDMDDCQWIRASGGEAVVHFGKGDYNRPSYAIYVRGVSNEETYKRTLELFAKIRNFTDSISAFIATRLPQYVGKDEKNRSVYTFQIQYQSGAY